MGAWLILGVLLVEVALLAAVDRILYRSWLSPSVLLGCPYAIIVSAAVLLGPSLDFLPVHGESILVWIVGLPVFWLGGLPIALWAGDAMRTKITGDRGPYLLEQESQRVVLALAGVSIVVLAYGFLTALRSVGGLVGDDFSASYGSGLSGHFMIFGIALLIFLIGTASTDRKLAALTAVVLSIMVLGNQIKYLIVVPVVGGLIYRVMTGRLEPSFRKAAIAFLFMYALFNAAYLIGFTAADPVNLVRLSTYTWMLRHFIAYMFAGVLGLSEGIKAGILTMHGNPTEIFAPFVNMFAVLTSGDFAEIISREDFVIDVTGAKHSNVHTLMGTLLMRLGLFRSIVYVAFMGVISYGAFALATLSRNCWFLVMYALIGGALALGWFVFFFNNLTFIEIPVYAMALAVLLRLRGQWMTPDRVAGAGLGRA